MKKLMTLLLALMMLFSVAAVFSSCEDSGKKKSSSSKSNDDEDEDIEDEEDEENEEKDDDGKQENPDIAEDDPVKLATNALETYLSVAYRANASLLERIAPPVFWERNGYDSLDGLKASLSGAVAQYLNGLSQQYGDNIEFTYNIKKSEILDTDRLTVITEALADRYGIDTALVENGVQITIVQTFSGDKTSETLDDVPVYVICYDGIWYCITGESREYNGTMCHDYLFIADFVISITQRYLYEQGQNTENPNIPMNSSAEQALQDYIDVYYYGNADKLEASAPREFWDTVCEDYSLSDLKEAMAGYIAEMKEMATAEVGENYFVHVVVTNNTPMDVELLNNCADSLEDNYGINPDLVQGGCILTCDMTAGGDDSEETMTGEEVYMLCYDGTWYPIEINNYHEDNESFYCDFIALSLLWTLEYYLG